MTAAYAARETVNQDRALAYNRLPVDRRRSDQTTPVSRMNASARSNRRAQVERRLSRFNKISTHNRPHLATEEVKQDGNPFAAAHAFVKTTTVAKCPTNHPDLVARREPRP